MTKKYNFEAETGKILELLTHSIYSNKEIFLRELISNASDAIDKARIKSLTDTNFLKSGENFEIKISVNKKENKLIIEDNGIGMTKEELQKNLGTIAKSGTKEFLEKLEKAKQDSKHNLIGQFGVGFYSAFMVADKVEVESKSAESKQAYKWISDGKTGYEIISSDKKDRGTKITLYIDEANKELLEEYKIRELVKKYSNYLSVPIKLEVEQKDKDGKVTGKKWEQINETKAIWKKSKQELKKEELKEFYQSLTMDFNDYLTYIHINAEGIVSYKSLLFVPKQKNMFVDLSDPSKEYGPKLYIQNVLILEHAKELLPTWLRFVSGVVETTDLPLNISREMLQANPNLEKIKKALTKKILSELEKTLKNSRSDYEIFMQNYGRILKEGIYYDSSLKENIAGVCLWNSMLKDKKITLEEYLQDLKVSDEKQKFIYYITAKSVEEALASPYLNQFRENNVDVLILTDPIDDFIVQVFGEYSGVKLKSVTSSDIKLKEETQEEKKQKEEKQKEFKDLLELTKNTIGTDKIEKVDLNENLGDAPFALKTPEGGLTPQMEKMYKAMGQDIPAQKRILELNPKHKLVQTLKKEFEKDVKSQKLKDLINYAYYESLLLEGGELENIKEFSNLINKFALEYLD